MYTKSILALLAGVLAGQTLATSQSSSSTKSSSTTTASSSLVTDNYDNLNPGVQAAPLQNQVGLYNGLQYYNIFVGGPSPLLANNAHEGVIPTSAPNEAVIVATDLTNLTAPASITVAYSGSPYSTFDLISFFFGCSLYTNQGEESVAQGCVIAVNGFYPNGGQTGVATFGFVATNPVNSPMFLARLPLTFLGVQNVTIGVAASASTPATTNVEIDNLVHFNHK